MKIVLPEEDVKFLKELANEIKTQDNRGTASPYYYTVRQKKRIVGIDANYSENTVWLDTYSGEFTEWATEEDAIKAVMKDHELDREAAEKFVDDNVTEFGTTEYEYDTNVFLTYKGFLEHMKLNGHNYSGRHDGDNFKERDYCKSYVEYAHRNPELKRLLEIIMKFGEK